MNIKKFEKAKLKSFLRWLWPCRYAGSGGLRHPNSTSCSAICGTIPYDPVDFTRESTGKPESSWPNILTAALLCFFIVLQSVFAKLKERKK